MCVGFWRCLRASVVKITRKLAGVKLPLDSKVGTADGRPSEAAPSRDPTTWWRRGGGCIGGGSEQDSRPAPAANIPSVVVHSPAIGGAASPRQSKDETSGEHGGAPGDSLHTRFVAWNMQRAVRGKVPQLEMLLRELRSPTFVALSETADVDVTDTELNGMAERLGYVILGQQRRRPGARAHEHGGVLLLVSKGLVAERYTWPEAAAWSNDCECVSAMIHPANGAPPFIVSSLYVSDGSTDVAGFGRLLDSALGNQIIMGDLNSQLPDVSPGIAVRQAHLQRGELLAAMLADVDRGWFAPTPTGVTRPATEKTRDGKVERLATGTNYDHILVGGGVAAHISASEPEAFVCEGSWPSDHLPLAWSADMAVRAVPARQRESWQRGIAWHDVLPHHVRQFNSCFQNQLRVAATSRRWQMAVVETALVNAGRSALPRTRAPRAPSAAAPAARPPPLFDTLEARQHVAAAAAQHGGGNAGKLSRAATEARRMVLAKFSKIEPNPSSAWRFLRTFFGFGNNSALKPPLDTEDPGRKVTAAQDRCETLGRLYAQVHSDPPSSSVKAQEELAAIEIPAPERRPHTHLRSPSRSPSANSVSVTELRACFGNFQTGKASDFMGIKVEHLRLLDDASLAAMLPFFDRCITRAALPSHWCTAFVTPIPKPKRDLAIRRNWRPVSVTALLCRACEAIIHNRVQHRIEQNGGAFRRGKSQFGFRRGVGTSLPLAGLSMFIRDGQQQTTKVRTWLAAHDGERRPAADTDNGRPERQHDALLVCVDASDAFCRALPAKAVRRLLDMGLITEARWVKALLTRRTLCVREDGKLSGRFAVDRGVPQGSILGPLLWSLVIDDLIAQCEAECRIISPGCVAIPIIFADDINFVIRGFNPSSMVAKANRLLSIVNNWSLANDIPMAKLQASWLSACYHDRTNVYANWTKRDGEVILNDAVRCTPGVQPVKILGVTYDSDFSFSTHVDNILEECTRHKRLLFAMAKSVKADKLTLLYRGLILSRLLYGIEAWYPFIRRADADRLQTLHRDCCFAITGCRANSHGESVCLEAGFYKFDAVVRDELVKLADKLRRYPQPPRTDEHAPLFGPEWVASLFRDERMPTAAPRMPAGGSVLPVALWPESRFNRRREHDAHAHHMSIRDIGMQLFHGSGARRGDPRVFSTALRPLPAAFPFAPEELQVFDTHVKFVTNAPSQPGGAPLVKPDNFEMLTWEQKQPFRQANIERIDELVRQNGPRTLYIFTDGARREGAPGHESCAGAFVVCSTAEPRDRGDVIYQRKIPANPIACIYTAELLSIYEALTWVRNNRNRLAEYDRVVLITDSKSALESMQSTWLSRIGDLEQRACRALFELATMGQPVHTTLAFVFSHTGGCPGNELADKLATEALPVIGLRWRSDELWDVDTTRRIQRDMHDDEHGKLDRMCFRSRHAPKNGRRKLVPSERLPTSMSRTDEVLLFRARVGTMPDVGGFLHGNPDPCPICCAAGALGRGGTTIEHLLSCHPALKLAPPLLWSDPTAAVSGLRAIRKCAMDTGRCFVQLASGSSDLQQDARQRAARARQLICNPQQPQGYLHFLG